MDLGKSMERLLTLDEKTYTRLLLHRKVIDETVDPWAESAYNYMVTKDGAILRSQLDCAIKVAAVLLRCCAATSRHGAASARPTAFLTSCIVISITSVPHCFIQGTSRIFDLKTRATNAIRLNVEQYAPPTFLFTLGR
jgi:hypothetical protein